MGPVALHEMAAQVHLGVVYSYHLGVVIVLSAVGVVVVGVCNVNPTHSVRCSMDTYDDTDIRTRQPDSPERR